MAEKKPEPKKEETLPTQLQGVELPKGKPQKLEKLAPDGPCGGTPCGGGLGSD